jgi:hypothetical protein
MKYFKSKAAKWLAAALATAALVSIGVHPQIAAGVGNALGEQAAELVE